MKPTLHSFKFLGKDVQWGFPGFLYCGKHNDAWLACNVWMEPGKDQQSEQLTLEELSQLLGGGQDSGPVNWNNLSEGA